MNKELTYCRVPEWHSTGFTGKGIKVLVYEVNNPTIINYPDYKGKVIDINGNCFGSIPRTHMEDVVDTLLLYAPDVEIYLWRDNLLAAVQFCIDNNIDVFNYSATGSYSTTEFNALEEKAIANGTFFVCSAGNDGSDGLTGFSQKSTWLSVGSVRMSLYDQPIRTNYSSYDGWGKDLDVMAFGDITFNDRHIENEIKSVSGTSFSSPSIVGMLSCYKQYFMETFKRKPTWTETYNLIINNCVDIEEIGYDVKTGNGVFQLPEIIKISEKLTIEVTIGSTQAKLNGQPYTLLIAPQIFPGTGRTVLGLRDISNLIGGTLTLAGNDIKIVKE